VRQEELNFGGVYVGATHRLAITLMNTSMIPAMVIINLAQFPEFYIDPDIEERGNQPPQSPLLILID
jgi:hypothetical protein